MIKRIIFDIDNTLIDFPLYYEKGYQQILDKYKTGKKANELYDAIGYYEECGKYDKYDYDELLKVINNYLHLELDNNFLDDYFNMYNNLETFVSDSVKETLKYLSEKYELVTLSNWFTTSQEERLKKVDILKYFTKVYGTDIVPMKPKKEAFESVIGKYKLEECLIIGDNVLMDIEIPYQMGMHVYHLCKNKNSEYPCIRKIEELKELL